MKVFVGLSGGVDSAVSAALLQNQGHEVTGVFIRIAIDGYPCTAGTDKIEAMRVAAHLKINFIEIDLSDEYKNRVVDISIQEFAAGRTPNPDVLCNREIKFGLFYDWARKNGADVIATGHYAQVKTPEPAHELATELRMGADKEKDQSYFLWAVPGEALAHTLFPIGHMQKSEVRRLAEEFGLPNAGRKDSQGLCFLGPVSMGDMLERELKPVPGDVLSESGEAKTSTNGSSPDASEASRVIGTHDGAVLYTLGERRGFTLHTQTADSLPHYVIAKDLAKNTITVSPDKFPKDATKTEVELSDVNWIGPYSAKAMEGEKVMARYRYRQTLIPAELDIEKNKVILKEPHYIPEGQSLVLYQGDRCLGGGVIKKSAIY